MSKQNPEYLHYFAYGSNMNPKRLFQRLTQTDLRAPWISIQAAVLPEYRLVFNKHSADGSHKANIEPCPGAQVEGQVYTIHPDGLAGLRHAEAFPDQYLEHVVKVRAVRSQQELEVMTYLATPKYTATTGAPRSEYLGNLLAAPDWALSPGYRQRLSETTTLEQRDDKHFIAVYGTLRKGQAEQQALIPEATHLGRGQTCDRYQLSVNQFPVVSKEPGISHVQVDVFLVNQDQLAQLDQYEQHPELYCREKTAIKMHEIARHPESKGTVIQSWMYFSPEAPQRVLLDGDFLGSQRSLKAVLPLFFQSLPERNIQQLRLINRDLLQWLEALALNNLASLNYSERDVSGFVQSLIHAQRFDLSHFAPGWWSLLPGDEDPPEDVAVDFIVNTTLLVMGILNQFQIQFPQHGLPGFNMAWNQGLKLINHQDVCQEPESNDPDRDKVRAQILALGQISDECQLK